MGLRKEMDGRMDDITIKTAIEGGKFGLIVSSRADGRTETSAAETKEEIQDGGGSDKRSPEFEQLWAGVNRPCCLQAPPSPPPWLNSQLYDQGLAFFYKNLLGVVASNGEALVMGLAIPSFYRVLAFSGQTRRKREAVARKVAVYLRVACDLKHVPFLVLSILSYLRYYLYTFTC